MDAEELRRRLGQHIDLRRALENSRNLATVHLLDGGIEKKPEASLNRLCELAVEAQIYRECVRYYPFVLGAQPVRPIESRGVLCCNRERRITASSPFRRLHRSRWANDLSLSAVPVPYDQLGRPRRLLPAQDHDAGCASAWDRARDFGPCTLRRGQDRHLGRGKRRLVCRLTNDVTVAVWLGYDNATGKRRTLGGGATGGGVAVPIFEPIRRSGPMSRRERRSLHRHRRPSASSLASR